MASEIAVWRLAPHGDGSLTPISLAPAPQTLNDLASLLPAGGYTTFRTFGRSGILHLSDHLARLEETAHLSGKPIQLDQLAIRRALHHALITYETEPVRGRLVLDLTVAPGTIYIALAQLVVPTPSQYEHGVRTVTCQMHRENPKAKSTAFLLTAEAVRADLPPGIEECLMVGDDGLILEGLSSNFFAVRAGELWTAAEGVLPGLTRALVLEEIAALSLPYHLQGVPLSEVGSLDEAFITSASRAILPIVEINGTVIGGGKPGPISQALLSRYQARVMADVEQL